MSVCAKLLENIKCDFDIFHPAANDITVHNQNILVTDFNGFITLYKRDKKIERWKTTKKKNLVCRGACWLTTLNS